MGLVQPKFDKCYEIFCCLIIEDFLNIMNEIKNYVVDD